jgi:hypothetical protein
LATDRSETLQQPGIAVDGDDSEIECSGWLTLDTIKYIIAVETSRAGESVPSRDLIPLNGKESLTPREFNPLSDIPSELEWLANKTNPITRAQR